MFKTYLPFILLAFVIGGCVVVLWMIDHKIFFHTNTSNTLFEQIIRSPLALSSDSSELPSPTPPTQMATFSDGKMNIQFSYPVNLQVEKKSDHMLWVHTDSKKDESDSLLIYVDKVSKSTTADVTVPFKVDGEITQSMKIRKEGFNARLVTFTKGALKTQIFFFRSDTQVVIARPSMSDAVDPDVAYAITQSIQKIK